MSDCRFVANLVTTCILGDYQHTYKSLGDNVDFGKCYVGDEPDTDPLSQEKEITGRKTDEFSS